MIRYGLIAAIVKTIISNRFILPLSAKTGILAYSDLSR